ncbi:MAG TPA: hypothetical protein VI316_10015 [Candidatus Dormibacteraeota bacterium]
MLTLAELAALPLRAATYDEAGNEVARTPEWRGAGASAVPFRYEGFRLVVAPHDPGAAASVGEALVQRLIEALEDAGAAVDEISRRRLAVLTEGVRIAAGRVAYTVGTSADAVAYLEASLPVRSDVRLFVAGAGGHAVVAPAAIAAALLQIVVNAERHGGAETVDLAILSAHGALTFRLQWAGAPPPGARLQTSRTQRQAKRTGLASARVISDAVGATLTGLLSGVDAATGTIDGGRSRVELALPATDLALPLARVEGGLVGWCTRTWSEETGLLGGRAVVGPAARCVELARARPGSIVTHRAFTARAVEGTVWIAQPPDDPTERSILAARLVDHERALANAPPPHRGRIRALAALLLHVLGTTLPTVSGDAWNAGIDAELSAYGLPPHVPTLDAERVVAPPVCAYLMSECGAGLVQDGDELQLTVREGMRDHPLVRLLSADGERILLTPEG